MDNTDPEVLRELREMRAEIQHLRRIVLLGFIGIAAVTAWIIPDSITPMIGALILLAFLFYPKSFIIFPPKKDGQKIDA